MPAQDDCMFPVGASPCGCPVGVGAGSARPIVPRRRGRPMCLPKMVRAAAPASRPRAASLPARSSPARHAAAPAELSGQTRRSAPTRNTGHPRGDAPTSVTLHSSPSLESATRGDVKLSVKSYFALCGLRVCTIYRGLFKYYIYVVYLIQK